MSSDYTSDKDATDNIGEKNLGCTDPPPPPPSIISHLLLSRLRQNLREKHSRHVADLKAYYEYEIQVLRDKLALQDPPGDLERSNRMLSDRFVCFEGEKKIRPKKPDEIESPCRS